MDERECFLSGSDYSIIFDNNSTNTQNYYLTIHKASPGAYTCMLISTKKKVIDAKTQHVITESEYFLRLVLLSTINFIFAVIGNPMISSFMKEMTQFLKWN